MSAEPIIQFKHIDITYNAGKSNEFKASNDISFDIYKGEYIIFFGPSGCGKSTLMYCVLGSLPPSAGDLLVKGQNPYKFSSQELVEYQRSTVGIIFQAFYLIPSITVADNVVLPRIFAGDEPDVRRKRAERLLTKFGVAMQADKLPLNLSGGQQQRVAVSRSLVGDPEILLADEPVGNLDSKSTDEVMGMLNDINAVEKKTVILVTHDAKHLPFAHRVIYFRDGHLERIVPNPEKEQIMQADNKGIVTEIEKLARIHPYLSPDQLKVKSIVNYLTQDFGIDQIQRLEHAVELMRAGKIHRDDFYQILVTPFNEGGVDIEEERAKRMADQTERMIREAQAVARFRRRIVNDKEPAAEHQEHIIDLRKDLLDEYPGDVSQEQVKNLERAISERLEGELKRPSDFMDRLRQPVEEKGLGLNKRMAQKLSTYLEKLIAQGIQVGGGGH